MARIGEITHRIVEVRNSTTGALVTGLTGSDFTVTTRRRTAAGSWGTYSASVAVVEIGSGLYGISFLMPAERSWFDVRVSSTGRDIFPQGWIGQVEAYDADTLAAIVSRPSAVLTASTLLGAEMPLTLAARRWRSLTIGVVDADGSPIDLSSYTAWRLGLRNIDGSLAWESGTGTYKVTNFTLTGSAGGVISCTIPENLTLATARPNSTAMVRGDVVQAGDLTAICTVAGTTHSAPPTWPTVPGNTVTDGGVTWRIQGDPYTLANALPGGTQAGGRWEIIANAEGNVARTVPVIRSSPLALIRDEAATQYVDPSA